MTEEKLKKKRRTLEQQIAALEARKLVETDRLLCRDQAQLAAKALNKADFPLALVHLETAASYCKKYVADAQVEIEVDAADESPLG